MGKYGSRKSRSRRGGIAENKEYERNPKRWALADGNGLKKKWAQGKLRSLQDGFSLSGIEIRKK